jgi:hypothetical protein
VGATNLLDRLACSLGSMEAVDPCFRRSMDIPNGGVLLALPALLANGLMRYTDKYFQLPKGYYGLNTIFLIIAFMLLARIKSIEGLRYCAPGEWGKLLGLDRIPEVKTFREKVSKLAHDGKVGEWSAEICRDWMNEHPEHAASLYIDGHVRVYHGHQANIPKHYVSREKLCLRATCDYWVNAMDGKPFFVIPKDVDPGLLNVLENEIVPRALKEVPCQLTEEEMEKDPLMHRFILIFDREGYSPDFMNRMKELRIACMTYNKFPKENWGEEEFRIIKVQLVSGEVVDMKLAERGTLLNQLWVRETRRLTSSGHQTSIISTAYRLDAGVLAMGMFARWSQENFFKYMRQNYSLDRLIEYTVEEIPDNIKVVNPKYRNLDGEVRSKTGKLNRKIALFGAMTIEGEIEPKKVENYQKRKAELQEEISLIQIEVNSLKDERKKTKKHILVSELPEEDRLQRLNSKSKDFLDTIKMICYRGETAMVKVVREVLSRADDARSFIRSLYDTEVDIFPDEANQVLKIRLHHLTTRSANEVAQHLCNALNETEAIFPGTNLRIFYEMVSS